MVEHRNHNPLVGGSNPSPATRFLRLRGDLRQVTFESTLNAMSMFMPQSHKSLFRQLLAGLYDAVLIADPNGHILEINPRAVEFFGYSGEEAADRPVEVFIPGVTPRMIERIREGLTAKRHVVLDANCPRRDGTSFSAEVSISEIELFEPGDLVFTVRNVERRRRQLDVYKSKENAFALSAAALFVCAPDGRFRQVNRAFCDMFGLEDEEAAGHHFFADFMSDEPLPALFECALEGEGAVARVKAESEGGDGAAGELEVRLEPDMHGKRALGVVGSVAGV